MRYDCAGFVVIPLLVYLSQHRGILGQLLPELNNVIFFFGWLRSWLRLWLRWISLQKVIDSQLLIVNLRIHTLHFIENCSALRSTKFVDFTIGILFSIFQHHGIGRNKLFPRVNIIKSVTSSRFNVSFHKIVCKGSIRLAISIDLSA